MSQFTQTGARAAQQGRIAIIGRMDNDELDKRRKLKNKVSITTKLGMAPAYNSSDVSPEMMDMAPGEIALKRRSRGVPGREIEVFSSLNGVHVRKTVTGTTQLHTELDVVGIVDTPLPFTPERRGPDYEKRNTIQIGGVRNVLNTSREDLNVGDWVYAHFPSEDELDSRTWPRGIPRGKIVAELRKFNPQSHVNLRTIGEQLGITSSQTTFTEAEDMFMKRDDEGSPFHHFCHDFKEFFRDTLMEWLLPILDGTQVEAFLTANGVTNAGNANNDEKFYYMFRHLIYPHATSHMKDGQTNILLPPNLTKLLSSMLSYFHVVNSRMVGRVLDYSRPSSEVPIIIGGYSLF